MIDSILLEIEARAAEEEQSMVYRMENESDPPGRQASISGDGLGLTPTAEILLQLIQNSRVTTNALAQLAYTSDAYFGVDVCTYCLLWALCLVTPG